MSTPPVQKHVLDNRSNQLNPRRPEYYKSRGLNLTVAETLAENHRDDRPTAKNIAAQLPPAGKPKK